MSCSASRDRADDPIRRDLADAVVIGVSDEEITCPVYSDGDRVVECGQGRRTVVSEESRNSVTRDRSVITDCGRSMACVVACAPLTGKGGPA